MIWTVLLPIILLLIAIVMPASVYAQNSCGPLFVTDSPIAPLTEKDFISSANYLVLKDSVQKKMPINQINQYAETYLKEAQQKYESIGGKSELIFTNDKWLLVIKQSESPIGKVSAKIKSRFDVEIVYDPVYLIQKNSLGYADFAKKTLGIPAKTLANGEINSTVIHEIRHIYLSWLTKENLINQKPQSLLTGRVHLEKNSKGSLSKYGYGEGFRVDEMFTHTGDLFFFLKDFRKNRINELHWKYKNQQLESEASALNLRMENIEKKILTINKKLSRHPIDETSLMYAVKKFLHFKIEKPETLQVDLETLIQEKALLTADLLRVDSEINNLAKPDSQTGLSKFDWHDIKALRIDDMAQSLVDISKSAWNRKNFYYNRYKLSIYTRDRLGNSLQLSLNEAEGVPYIAVEIIHLHNLTDRHGNLILKTDGNPEQFKVLLNFNLTEKSVVENFKNNLLKETNRFKLQRNPDLQVKSKALLEVIDNSLNQVEAYHSLGNKIGSTVKELQQAQKTKNALKYLNTVSKLRAQLLPFFYPRH